MLHPEVKIKKSKIEGIGLHATTDCPAGTIIWHPCKNCNYFSKNDLKLLSENSPRLYYYLDEYGYHLSNGSLILKCQQGFLFNHCCEANVLDYGLDFGVAIRDIIAGEELLCDYRTYSDGPEWEIQCLCKDKGCSKIISSKQNRTLNITTKWKTAVSQVIGRIGVIQQALHNSLKECSEIYCSLLKSPENFQWQTAINVQNPGFLN